MGFTVCVPYCLADGGGLLILPFVNGFHHGLHAVLLRSWQQIHQEKIKKLSLHVGKNNLRR